MNTKSAFKAAVGGFPDAARALAAFASRFSRKEWPVSNYRCPSAADAAAVEAFLKGCGMQPGADFTMAASAFDPESVQLRWNDGSAAPARLCAALESCLPDDDARIRLYAAPAEAPGLVDGRDAGEPEDAPADPLGLSDATLLLARRILAGEWTGDSADYLLRWANSAVASGPVTAPLWVLERTIASGEGAPLARPAFRSREGLTFAAGRYVKWEERLDPFVPLAASRPLINTLGTEPLEPGKGPLAGYLAATRAHLEAVPGKSRAGRCVWLHLEDAYIVDAPDEAGLRALVDPGVLWPRVARAYAALYGHAVVPVPGMCHVHCGRDADACVAWLSSLERAVSSGERAALRFCLMVLPDGAVPKPAAAPEALPRVLWADQGGRSEAPGRDPMRVDARADAAAEWFAMTHHAVYGAFPHGMSRSEAKEEMRRLGGAELLRRLCADVGRRPPAEASGAPEHARVGINTTDAGWFAAHHFVYDLIEGFRTGHCLALVPPETWRDGTRDPELHAAPKMVPAVMSWVTAKGRGDDLCSGDWAPEAVTEFLESLTPERQLQAPGPAGELEFHLAVETNFAIPGGDHDEDDLKDKFLRAFQANVRDVADGSGHHDSSVPSWTCLCSGCHWTAHGLAAREIGFAVGQLGVRSGSNGRSWSWISPEDGSWLSDVGSRSGMHGEGWDAQNGDVNCRCTDVRVLRDAHGRMVVAVTVRGPSAEVARTMFRWYTGLPLLSNQQCAAAAAESAPVVLDPADPAKSMDALRASCRTRGAQYTAPGWTNWLGPHAAWTSADTPGPQDYMAWSGDRLGAPRTAGELVEEVP